MTLATEVTGRVSNELLVSLTNQDTRAASTVNTTRLGYAATDATALFQKLTGLTFDLADASHVAAAVPGVLWQLQRYTGRDDTSSGSFRSQFEEACRLLTQTDGSKSLPTFQTNSAFAPTVEGTNELPPFDRYNQAGYKIGWPPGQPDPDSPYSDLPSGG